MRPYTNASAHYIFAMKAFGSHTDAIEGPEMIKSSICCQTVTLCGMTYTLGFTMAVRGLRNRFPSLPGAADKGSV